MATLAELSERLERLRAVRADGARDISYGDERVVYGSDSELAAAIADVERQILVANGTPPVRMVRFSSSKGL